MDPVQLDRTEPVDEVGEHASPSDRGELARVTNEDYPPIVPLGEPGEFGELGGGGSAGFVDDHRGTSRQVVRRFGWSRGMGVLCKQLVQRVSGHRGLAGEDLGCRRGRCHPEGEAATGG